MDSSLSHVRVIDVTHCIAGPYCTKLMAGFGAEVIKVERPRTGDRMRSMGPFFRNAEGEETSIPFLWLNTGKKSISLNLKTSRGVQLFKCLVESAAVVIENFSPRVMPSLDLDYGILREINANLIMTSISNFGQTGPNRDYAADEIELYAMSGLMHETGDRDGAPLSSGPAVAQYSAGVSAYIGTLLALFHRTIMGQGQHVDVSIQEAAANNVEVSLIEHLRLGKVRRRNSDHHQIVPWELYDCADGRAAVIGGPIRHWLKGAELFEEPRILADKYAHVIDRIEHRDELEGILRPRVRNWPKKELFRAGQEKKLAFGYLAGLDDVLESPQHDHRGFFQEIDHPKVGGHKVCGAPFKMSETPWRNARAPLLGEHNETVYQGDLNLSPQEMAQLRREGVV